MRAAIWPPPVRKLGQLVVALLIIIVHASWIMH
jgi:hypothetical protein